MLLDWSYYDRDFSEEELVIATRIFGMFVWPIVIISGLYLAFIHPRYSLEDFKK